MPSKKRSDDENEGQLSTKEKPEIHSESRIARIGGHVVRSLGSPTNYRGVKVCPVGSDSYRVNVMAALESGGIRIVDSFFVTADSDGNILESSPKLVRRY